MQYSPNTSAIHKQNKASDSHHRSPFAPQSQTGTSLIEGEHHRLTSSHSSFLLGGNGHP
jgi:hypothetical protein